MGAEAQPYDQRLFPWLSAKWEMLNSAIKYLLAVGSYWLLDWMGYDVVRVGINIVKIKGYGGVGIGNYCLAMELMALFVALIISFPANVYLKGIFIVFGLIAIQFINMLRVVALNLMTVYAPQYLEFNHHFTFRITVFIFILLLYRWFIISSKKPRWS
ncbi:MAG: exosortase/archaeosortase family protein [Chitinophagales bacterium]|nr:exosortase/archaeosortase family protein [Chitinophagales bacterium]